MKRFLKIFVASILASALTVTSAFAAPTSQELEDQKNALEDRKNEAQNQVDSLQGELTEVLQRINKLEEDLIAKGEEIQQATTDLEAAEEKEQQQYEDMKLRIKYMYEEGGSSFIETLCSATDFADLINKAEYVENVSTYDREMMNQYVETKEQIAALKVSLEEDAKELESMQADYEAEKEALNSNISSKQAEVSDFDSQIQAAAEAVAAAKAEEEAAAKRAAEEAAAAAAAEAGNNSGTNDSNTGSVSNNTNTNTNTGTNTGGGNTSNNSGNTSSSSGNTSSSSGNTSAAQTIVNAAESQLGVTYVWGGTNPGVGLDCSGLTQYCHRQAGISIARTSGAQGGGGVAVSSPQAGDLVCYAGHVGIYIGNGQMIHAPHTGAVVRVQSVYGSPWYRRYW